jgi:acetyl-CoA carboxylase carboxyltransferase component
MTEEDPRILKLREVRAKAKKGGGESRIAKQHEKGKLTARERINLLLDPETFQELESFVTRRNDLSDESSESILGDGVIIGYGQVNGRTVFVYAQDFTIMGGALGEMQSHKICHVMDLAAQNGAPIIGMIDSGGARIQEGVRSLGGYAQIFKRNSLYSGVIPQISLILGPCAGGAAYSPALTDLIIMVEKQSYMFLTEVHMTTSGTAHLTAKNEPDAIALCRNVLSYLPNNNVENPPVIAPADDPMRMDKDLNRIVPIDPSTPYDMHEVIQRVVDRSSLVELQNSFASNAIVGFARMNGSTVGIVAQEPSVIAGVIDIDAADKIFRFVRMCDCFNIPLVTFVDSPGFLPGVNQEHRGIIRHGAKVLFAYAEATVPKVSIVTRKAYGGAYIVMSSKYLGTDVTYAWPSAEIAVMGPEGATNILYRKQIEEASDKVAERKRLTDEFREKFLNPYAAAQAGYIDEVIEPCETRARVIAALSALREKQTTTPNRKHGNFPV